MSAHLTSNTTSSSMLPTEPKCCGHHFAVPECFVSDSCVLSFNCKFLEVRQPISVYLPPACPTKSLCLLFSQRIHSFLRTWSPQSGFILHNTIFLSLWFYLELLICICNHPYAFLLFICLLLVSPSHHPPL